MENVISIVPESVLYGKRLMITFSTKEYRKGIFHPDSHFMVEHLKWTCKEWFDVEDNCIHSLGYGDADCKTYRMSVIIPEKMPKENQDGE